MSKKRKQKSKNLKHQYLMNKIRRDKHNQDIEDLKQFEKDAEGKTF